jgi:isoamylase
MSRVWHGVKLGDPDWSFHSHSLAYRAACRNDGLHFYAIWNAYSEPLEFELPPTGRPGALGRRWIDTSLDSPEDFVERHAAPPRSGAWNLKCISDGEVDAA